MQLFNIFIQMELNFHKINSIFYFLFFWIIISLSRVITEKVGMKGIN
jgi:hypothetical protein